MFIWEEINLDPQTFDSKVKTASMNRINNFKIIKVKGNERCSQRESSNVSNSEKEIYQGLD